MSMQGTEKMEYFEITKRSVSESNLSALSRELALFNWNALKSIEDVNELYDSFSAKVISLYDECCSVVKIRVKRLDKEKPYVNSRGVPNSDLLPNPNILPNTLCRI